MLIKIKILKPYKYLYFKLLYNIYNIYMNNIINNKNKKIKIKAYTLQWYMILLYLKKYYSNFYFYFY